MARECLLSIGVILFLVLSSVVGVSQAGQEQRSGWEHLNLSRTTIAETTVYYEKALEPNLPVFEREFQKLLDERSKGLEIADKKDAIIADINRLLGVDDTDSDGQAQVLVTLAGSLSNVKLTLYLVRQQTIKDFLRKGGQLPSFSYDRDCDTVSYSPQLNWESDETPPEDFDFCIPVAPDKDFQEYVSGVLQAVSHFMGSGMPDVAIHEVTEMTLLRRARPTDPYWRWFSDGFANAITHRLVEKYQGAAAAQEFASAYELDKYSDVEQEINLAYWMMGNFCVYITRIPVEREGHILSARYAYSMSEAQRLIDEHGVDCVREILDRIVATESRTGSDLLEVVKDVTGEDMAARLAHYQTFTTKEEGIPKYGKAYQAALPERDWETMLVNVLRMMELRGDVFSLNYLMSFKNAALFLFKMGHEEAGDAAMRQAIDLYSQSPVEHGREAAMEMFVIYALECQNPAKAEREADELLELNPDNASSRTVKMLMNLKRGDLVEAKEIARQIQSRGNEQSTPYKLASRVLAIDANQASTHKQDP